MMDRRFGKDSMKENKGGVVKIEKKIVDSRRPNRTDYQPVPDLTDFMNDMFFGTVSSDKKAYNLNGDHCLDHEESSFDDSTRSNSSRLTQEWLEEARLMVASSPSRFDSPTRLSGSPRFAAGAGRLSSASILDRRDPLSRSARRQRPAEGFSGEILSKSAKHSQNKSESIYSGSNSPSEPSPALEVQRWINNISKPSGNGIADSGTSTEHSNTSSDPATVTLPPRQSVLRRSRFQAEPPSSPTAQGISVPPRRTFQRTPSLDAQLLSPPKTLVESTHRRSISSSTCSLPDKPLSPPKKLVESSHRRTISQSTCSLKKFSPPKFNDGGWKKGGEDQKQNSNLNKFLKEQRIKIDKILNREINAKAKVVLSGPSNSTSSMVAAICYAFLLQNSIVKKVEGNGEDYMVVVPVMNVRRGRMCKQRQAAWLFHHVGLDAASLLFADEVDLESLMMDGKLNLLVVGQDILRTKGEVGSQCTILTDNYCEDDYDLLQTPELKNLLLAGILLDTQNLNASASLSKTRDSEAVQLLLVGSLTDYRNTLYNHLTQEQRNHSFSEVLQQNYGKHPTESGCDAKSPIELSETERKSTSAANYINISEKKANAEGNSKTVKDKDPPKSAKPSRKKSPAQTASDESRGKNKFNLLKWFGFGR